MPDQIMKGSSELDAITPELWSARFYPTLKERMVFASSVSDDYQGEIAALGDQVNITTFPQFSEATELAEDAKNDADSITLGSTPLIINKQIVKDFIITKKGKKQSLEAGNRLRDLAFHSIMKKMQNIIIAAIVPNAAAPDHSISFDSGTTLALADILEVKELLDDADVPEEGRQGILGSAQNNDLFNITGFTSRDFIPAGSPLTAGAITTPVLGFTMDWTSEAGNTSYFFHPLFLQMAVQDQPAPSVHDLEVNGIRAERVNMTVLFGVAQIDGLRVTTLS